MRLATSEKVMSEEEHIQFELNSDIKHEYVNGKLIDMRGESVLNPKIKRV